MVASVVHRTARYVSATSDQSRKAIAQVFTPASVARFMAGRISRIGDDFSFVDAGAGSGILTAALCERIAAMAEPRRVTADLYETDPNVLPVLRRTVAECREMLAAAGHCLDAAIIEDDFVLRRPAASLYTPAAQAQVDAVIMNPPYAKLARDSAHARAFEEIVHGQPNVYALFMAAAVELLRPAGELVAITPRSYCNGLYFREFRRWLLDRMSLRRLDRGPPVRLRPERGACGRGRAP